MKKYLLVAIAVVLAISFSAFTSPNKLPFGTKYAQFNGGTERDFSNWSQLSATPSVCDVEFTPKACWIKVNAGADDVIQSDEFLAAFDAIDGGAGAGNNLISDEGSSSVIDINFSLKDVSE